METTINERARDAATAVRNAAVSACRQVAAVPRQALCEDTAESLTYLADRATRKVRRGLQSVEDVGSDTARCIKRHPFTAVGFTLAVGVAIGAVIGGFEMKRRLDARLRED
jgi:ElaB/YqjD/DUF883 family membrane-anchored ribosome-binding protein